MLIDLTLKINPKSAQDELQKLGHYGTHLDIMQYEDIPLTKFITTAKMFDITSVREKLVTLSDLPKIESINANDFVIFRSGWLQDKTYGTKEYFSNHPHLADDVIDYLIEKHIAFIGLDFPGAQRKELHLKVDNKCAAQGIFIIENMNNLNLIPQSCFKIYSFPMHLTGSTGIPIRVVAEIDAM